MGRGRVSMEPIKNEKKRQSTYKKRKEGLLKKVEEFKTLCDVDVCAIIYDPNSAEPETWPKEKPEVQRIIQKFHDTTSDRNPKIYRMEDYFGDKIKKIEAEKARVRKEIMKIKYPTWQEPLNNLGELETRMLITTMDAKLTACSEKRNMRNKAKEVVESLPNQIESNDLNLMMMQQNMMMNMMMMQQHNMMNSSISDHNNPYQFVGQSFQPNSMVQSGGEISYQAQNMAPCHYDGNYVQTMQQQYALSNSQNMMPQHQVFQYNYGLGDTNMQHQAQFFNYMNGRN